MSLHQVIIEEEALETGLIKVNDAGFLKKEATATQAAQLSSEEKARDQSLLPRYPGA